MITRYLDLASHLLVLATAVALVWVVATQRRGADTMAPARPAPLSEPENQWLRALAQRQALQALDIAHWQALGARRYAGWQIDSVAVRALPAQPRAGWLLSQIEATLMLLLDDETALDLVQQRLEQLPGVVRWAHCHIAHHGLQLRAECVVRWSGLSRVEARP